MKLEEKHMNGKVGVLTVSVLLAMLLVSAVVAVPGAAEQYESADPVVIRECLPAKEEVEKLNEFESPVAILIDELKSKNYTTEDIMRELAKQGYGWDPKTGACWKGTPPSAEEMK